MVPRVFEGDSVITFASLFTGGGGADQGARAAGLTPLWGVEYDAAIAAVAQQNDPACAIHVASVDDIDYAALPRADVLHASPPCPNFSTAKTHRSETAWDRVLARAVARAIDAQRPALFTLENVRAYGTSESLGIIQRTLYDLDYHVTTVIVNAADYGVPQTRERLLVIAHAGGWMQAARPLPASVPWIGWYAAIADLIPTLPDSQFAPWQLARLPEEVRGSLFFQNNDSEYGDPYRYGDAPAPGLTTQTGGRARAFIVDCQDSRAASGLTLRGDAEPMYTVSASMEPRRPARAWLIDGDNAGRKPTIYVTDVPAMTVRGSRSVIYRAWLTHGRVVVMTPRALARFQSFPDSYQLPDRKALACRVIGNAVPPLLYQRIVESQLCIS